MFSYTTALQFREERAKLLLYEGRAGRRRRRGGDNDDSPRTRRMKRGDTEGERGALGKMDKGIDRRKPPFSSARVQRWGNGMGVQKPGELLGSMRKIPGPFLCYCCLFFRQSLTDARPDWSSLYCRDELKLLILLPPRPKRITDICHHAQLNS